MIEYQTGRPAEVNSDTQQSHVTIQQTINGTIYGIKPWFYPAQHTIASQLTWIYIDRGTTGSNGLRIHNWIVC